MEQGIKVIKLLIQSDEDNKVGVDTSSRHFSHQYQRKRDFDEAKTGIGG